MTHLAVGKNDRLKASDAEFRMPVPSYTIDTLASLTEKFPGHTFSLIMGEDNLYTLHKWKNAEELARRYQIYVYPRPETVKPSSPLLDMILAGARVQHAKAPLMQISGTFIRSGIKKGKDMSYYLAAPVWKYIEEMHFYS